jgi:hypothetical protein
MLLYSKSIFILNNRTDLSVSHCSYNECIQYCCQLIYNSIALAIFRTVKQAKYKEEKLIVFGKILKSLMRLHSTYLGVMSAKAALVAHEARLILALSASGAQIARLILALSAL